MRGSIVSVALALSRTNLNTRLSRTGGVESEAALRLSSFRPVGTYSKIGAGRFPLGTTLGLDMFERCSDFPPSALGGRRSSATSPVPFTSKDRDTNVLKNDSFVKTQQTPKFSAYQKGYPPRGTLKNYGLEIFKPLLPRMFLRCKLLVRMSSK